MATTALAIFVKTPGLSPVKTRLAQTLGKELAEEIFSLSIAAIEAVANQAAKKIQMRSPHRLIPHWAIAERSALTHPLWQGFSRLHTGDGGLGDRLHHVYSSLLKQHDQVILIGADSPQITPELLLNAAAKISTSQSVICPTFDGGFALFGSQREIPKHIWRETPYSCDSTTAVLLSKLSKLEAISSIYSYDVYSYDPIVDIDRAADLAAICDEMAKLDLLPEQQHFLDWCSDNAQLKDLLAHSLAREHTGGDRDPITQSIGT